MGKKIKIVNRTIMSNRLLFFGLGLVAMSQVIIESNFVTYISNCLFVTGIIVLWNWLSKIIEEHEKNKTKSGVSEFDE